MSCILMCHIVIIRSMKILRSNLPIHKNVCDSLTRAFLSFSCIYSFTYKLSFRNARSNRGKMFPRAARNCQKTMARERTAEVKSMEKAFCVNFLFIFFFFVADCFHVSVKLWINFPLSVVVLVYWFFQRVSWAFLKKKLWKIPQK